MWSFWKIQVWISSLWITGLQQFTQISSYHIFSFNWNFVKNLFYWLIKNNKMHRLNLNELIFGTPYIHALNIIQNLSCTHFWIKGSHFKTSQGQNGLTYIQSNIWNKTLEILKRVEILNSFKQMIKGYYLNNFSFLS